RHSAATAITEGINGCGRFQYDMARGAPAYVTDDGCVSLSMSIARLKGADGNGVHVNCSDCAAFVVSFANLLGCELWSSQMGPAVIDDVFRTKPYVPIGFDAWTESGPGEGFYFHEVAWTGACGDDDTIYDACLKIDCMNGPAAPFRMEELPTGMIFSDGSADAPYVYRECLSVPGPTGYEKCRAKQGTRIRRRLR
ncbi:MAG: hypothetical protein Q4G65_18530, partial [bacterium]|nr:hypothetical protein [bacterium]